MAEAQLRLIDNRSARRYELQRGEKVVGFIAYDTQNGSVVLIHTEVDSAFEHRGLGSQLVAGALEDIRARGLSVVPICPFVSSYLRQHPEEADLVEQDPIPFA